MDPQLSAAVINLHFNGEARPNAHLASAIHRHFDFKGAQVQLISYKNLIQTQPQFFRSADMNTLLDIILHPTDGDTYAQDDICQANRDEAIKVVKTFLDMWPPSLSSAQIIRVIKGVPDNERPEALMDFLEEVAHCRESHFGDAHMPYLDLLKEVEPGLAVDINNLVEASNIMQCELPAAYYSSVFTPLGPDFSNLKRPIWRRPNGRAPRLKVLARR